MYRKSGSGSCNLILQKNPVPICKINSSTPLIRTASGKIWFAITFYIFPLCFPIHSRFMPDSFPFRFRFFPDLFHFTSLIISEQQVEKYGCNYFLHFPTLFPDSFPIHSQFVSDLFQIRFALLHSGMNGNESEQIVNESGNKVENVESNCNHIFPLVVLI